MQLNTLGKTLISNVAQIANASSYYNNDIILVRI